MQESLFVLPAAHKKKTHFTGKIKSVPTAEHNEVDYLREKKMCNI